MKADNSPCGDPVVERVVALLRHRAVVGEAKYPTNLEDSTEGAKAFCSHAQAEALDFANYLEVLKGRLERADELERLFDLQHTRMMEAIAMWRCSNPGNDLVHPDLGRLLEWFMENISGAKSCASCNWNRPVLVGAPCVKCKCFSEWVEASPLQETVAEIFVDAATE